MTPLWWMRGPLFDAVAGEGGGGGGAPAAPAGGDAAPAGDAGTGAGDAPSGDAPAADPGSSSDWLNSVDSVFEDDAGTEGDEDLGVTDEEVVTEEEEPAVGEEAPPAPAAEAAPELPEGVRVVEKNGVKSYVVPESVWSAQSAVAKLASEYEAKTGEPLTLEAATRNADAYDAIQRQLADFTSADLESVGAFADHLLAKAKEAREVDGVPYNPILGLTSQILEKSPEVRAALEDAMAPVVLRRDLHEVYQKATAANDQDTARSVQFVYKQLFGDYDVEKGMKENPYTPPAAGAPEKKAPAAGPDHRQVVANWTKTTNDQVSTSFDEKITNILGDRFDKFPEDKTNLQIRLRHEITQAIKAGGPWLDRVRVLQQKASETRSEARRAELQKEIVSRYAMRAAQVLDPAKNPKIKSIIGDTSTRIAASAKQQHARRSASQDLRTPGTGGTPAPRSIVPPVPKHGTEDGNAAWAANLDRVLAS